MSRFSLTLLVLPSKRSGEPAQLTASTMIRTIPGGQCLGDICAWRQCVRWLGVPMLGQLALTQSYACLVYMTEHLSFRISGSSNEQQSGSAMGFKGRRKA